MEPPNTGGLLKKGSSLALQLHYTGTKIRAVAAFDNSTQNKANPDPTRSVPWGQQSWDEMFFGSVTYKFVDQSGTKVASQ